MLSLANFSVNVPLAAPFYNKVANVHSFIFFLILSLFGIVIKVI